MRLLKGWAELILLFILWFAIPATLLYPVALWMSKHTQISGYALARGYVFAVALLWLPTAYLVDLIYGRSVCSRQREKPDANLSENRN